MLELEASDPTSAAESELKAAAAELRKTCATCQHFAVLPPAAVMGVCDAFASLILVPADGSGFCHRWEAKP